jgi:gamma-glutamyltranspeptidase/glutathione hydrolase
METPTFSRVAAAAPHILAAETGRTIMAEGGNAVEAMIGMAATIAMVYPHMNSIGGDAFWLVPRAEGPRPLHRGLRLCRSRERPSPIIAGSDMTRFRRGARSRR